MRSSTDTIRSTAEWLCYFFKETDLILPNDEWRVILNVNLSTYEDVLSVIKNDLFVIEKQKQDFTPTIELKQVECYFKMLEASGISPNFTPI
jgi:hypothetical protein